MPAGVLFASPVLVSHLNVLDNIRLPWVVDGERLDQAYLDILVDTLELRDVLLSYPADLSEELQFRVAGVRALAGRPSTVRVYPRTQASQCLDDLVFLAGALGQEVELVDAVAESEGDGSLKPAVALLPESLDDIAPARELSASQVRLVDQAQQILDLLPGPVIETGEFLHRGSEGTSLHGTKNSAHNHDLADNS
jgi:putative ABC transport system ATP-binding protein